MAILWHAPEAGVIVDTAITTISGSAALYGQQQFAQTTEDTNITINKDTLGGADDVLEVAQSFVATSPFVGQIIVKMQRTETPDAGVYMEIYEGTTNLPTGTVIATSATLAVTDFTSGSMAEETFVFTIPSYTMPLIPGKQYVFVIKTDATESDTNYYQARYKGSASSYSGGQLSRSDNGSDFTATATDDLYFKIRAGDIASYCKDLTIRGGERDVEALKLLGYNELIDNKRSVVIEMTFTAVYSSKMSQDWTSGAAQSVTGDYYRSQGGEKATNDRGTKSVLIRLYDGTNTVSLLLNNAYGTSSERSLAADGHMEETFTFKGLASNYYEEDDFA